MERRKVTFNIETAKCGFCIVYTDLDTDSTLSSVREAAVFCKTCAKFLCLDCLKPHRKLVVTENHQILNRDHVNLADNTNYENDRSQAGRYSACAVMDQLTESAINEYEAYRSRIMKTISKEAGADNASIDNGDDSVDDKAEEELADTNAHAYTFTEYCTSHPEEFIKYFCENHGKLICEICKYRDHDVCSAKVAFIPDMLKHDASLLPPFKKINSYISDFKEYDQKLQHDLKELKKSRENFLHDLKNKKREIIQWFNLMEVRAVKRVDLIFDRCKKDIEKKRQKAKDACRELRAEIIFLKEIQNSNVHDNIYKFIRMKRANEFVNETAKKKEHRQFTNTRFSLKLNEDFEKAHKDAEHLYDIKFEKKGETKFNVRLKEDRHVCNVTGCVILTSGGVVVADRNNANIKVFNSQFKLSSVVKIPDGVYDVDSLNQHSFAITSPLKSKINIVEIQPSQEVVKVLETGEGSCWGVKHFNGEFIVNCTTKNSNYIRAIDLDSRILFQVETKCNFSSEIFIDDVTKRLTISTATCYIDGNSTEIVHYVDEHKTGDNDSVDVLEYNYLNHLNTKGVTIDKCNNIVVCCKNTDQIYTIANSGNDAELLLAEPDGLCAPQALCYNQDKSKLLVTSENTDFVQIFEFAP